ncbi:MAG TPA: hypothetical protein VFB17_00755 [Gaiellaceae bacterium]|nr:hypothetical protein [Gaiellaceae bacterium]
MREPTLSDLRIALLRGVRTTSPLRAGDGDLAFERHQLLAARFLRTARLNRRPGAKSSEGWLTFFREHFPRGAEHARLLWTDWRKPLLQRGTAGARVTITHGQADAHWTRGDPGEGIRLVVDLESMWADFEVSVESFVDACASDRPRAKRALRRWRESTWTAGRFNYPRPAGGIYWLDPRLSSASTATSLEPVVYTLRPTGT